MHHRCDSDLDEEDHIVYGSFSQADPLCQKLNELIRVGLIHREDIFYKYLNDVVESRTNPFHKYSEDVINFFNTLRYLGGDSVLNMIRGPMYVL